MEYTYVFRAIYYGEDHEKVETSGFVIAKDYSEAVAKITSYYEDEFVMTLTVHCHDEFYGCISSRYMQELEKAISDLPPISIS